MMEIALQTKENVIVAYNRIKYFIHKTPIVYSGTLNNLLGSNVFFKIDALQKTGAFKIRGVLNKLLSLKEQGVMPSKIVAYSTGNHALAISYAAKLFGISARVYLPENVSLIKKNIAKYYGAEVITLSTRQEAEDAAKFDGSTGEYAYLHPSDDDEIIAGSGTMCFEALTSLMNGEIGGEKVIPDAIFASCGGGGLLSGTFLSKELLSPSSLLIGAEPEIANDAYLSLQKNSIYRFQNSPNTCADGLRALGVSDRTFAYLKKIDELMLVSEENISYWTAWLTQLIKITCEPSAAISMAAAYAWLKRHNKRDKTILVLISGGNIDHEFYKNLLGNECFNKYPVL